MQTRAGGEEEGGNAEVKKDGGYREIMLVCTTLILGAKIDLSFASKLFCFSPPTTSILHTDHTDHRDSGEL